MKTIEEIIEDHVIQGSETDCIEKEWAIACMKQYAVEVINELVDQFVEYPPKQDKDIIKIANRVKRGIHGILIEPKENGISDMEK